MNRRRLMVGASATAGVTIITGGSSLGWRSFEAGLLPGDHRPFEAWRNFGSMPVHARESLVAAAILASNPHNTQPWTFELLPDAVVVRPVIERNLGSFDPYLREMWIGLGCAVENMVQAGPKLGFRIGEPAVSDDGVGAIRVPLSRVDQGPAPLADALAMRRTNRSPYRAGDVPGEVLDALRRAAGGFDPILTLFRADSAAGAAFARQTLDGTARINADLQMDRDSHAWFRPNARSVAEHRSGVSIPTAGLDPFTTAMGQILPKPDDAQMGAYWLNSTRTQLASAPWIGTIAVVDLHDRAEQVAAGRLWQRLHLELTRLGFAAQPLNQLPELVDRERQLGLPPVTAAALREVEPSGRHVTFAFRLGLATREVPHSARHPLSEVIIPRGSAPAA